MLFNGQKTSKLVLLFHFADEDTEIKLLTKLYG